MKTNGNEFFYSVGGLMMPKYNVSDKIIDYIELFVDQIPMLTEQIRQYLKERKTVAFIANMKSIVFILSEIHANWLMTEAERILRMAESDSISESTNDIEFFISELLSLSIELQISQKNSTSKDKERKISKQSKISHYTDILNNINAICELTKNKDYDSAISMLDYIDDFKENNNAYKLMESIKSKNYKSVTAAAKALKNEYAGYLEKLGVTLSDLKKIILAVDDHPEILITIKGMLKGHFNVYAAAGGKTALAIMDTHKPNLFLLDIEMPDIGGFELAKTIRATEDHSNTPIVFLTSNATKEHVVEALRCGANDFIVKPASYNSLICKISKLI